MHCARAQGLELYANAEPCNEIVHCNSCPIFTLAAEQVLIHCTTAPRNAKSVSISSPRADRSYTYLLYFAHRERVQHCTLLTASEYRRSSIGAPPTYRRSLVYTRSVKSVTLSVPTHHLSVSAKRWRSHDSNAETVKATRVIAVLWPASYSIRAVTIVWR